MNCKRVIKTILSSKMMLALYLCYELIMFIIYYSDRGFLLSREFGHYRAIEFNENSFNTSYYYKFMPEGTYDVLNTSAILEFLAISVIPFFIYWIVRLVINALKNNKE